MPPPEIVRGYNDVIENGAERLFRQFELEAEHRRDLQRRSQTHGFVVALSGRVSALVFALTALGVSTLAIYLGQPWPASIIGGSSIALVVAAFTGVPSLLRQRAQQKQQQQPPRSQQ
jgi:uncharacterized membrane protein